MAYERRSFAAAAVRTTLASGVGAADETFSILDATGWPDGSTGKFYAVIDEGTSSEEKVLVTTRSTTTLLGVSRGADGTQTFSHSAGASIRVMFSGVDLDEANYWVSELASAASAANDLIIADADNSLSRVAKGSNSTVLGVSAGGALGYSTVTSAQITDGTIVNGDVNASAAIAASKLASIADQTLVGNTSGSAAAPSAIAASSFTDGFTTLTLDSDFVSENVSTDVIPDLQFATTQGAMYQVKGILVHGGYNSITDVHLGDPFGVDNTAYRACYIGAGPAFAIAVVDPEAGGGANLEVASSSSVKRAIAFSGFYCNPYDERLTWRASVRTSSDSGFGNIRIYAGSFVRYRALT